MTFIDWDHDVRKNVHPYEYHAGIHADGLFCFVKWEEDNMCNVPTINMTETGRNIVKLREKTGLSVRALQEIFGFATPNAIYKWQKGLAMPTVDNLIILAAIFDVSVDDIIAVNICSDVRISA